MKKLSSFFYKRSNLFICLSITAIMILFASLILGSQSKCITDKLSDEQSILGLHFSYNVDDVKELFESVEKEELECYAILLRIWDNIFPIIYCSMYIFWLSLIYKSLRIKSRRILIINLFPLLPAFVDWIENYFELKLISNFINYSEIIPEDVLIASIVTQIKWILSTINYLIILSGIFFLIRQKLQKRLK